MWLKCRKTVATEKRQPSRAAVGSPAPRAAKAGVGGATGFNLYLKNMTGTCELRRLLCKFESSCVMKTQQAIQASTFTQNGRTYGCLFPLFQVMNLPGRESVIRKITQKKH